MRHVSLAAAAFAVTALTAAHASAAPFEPATIPDQVGVVGHLDVDALRRTQLFSALGGQSAIDAALEQAPEPARPIARALSRSMRGVSFWHDADHGAVYVETRDAKSLGHLIATLPVKPAPAIDGFPAYTFEETGHHPTHGVCAIYSDTLILSDSVEAVERSIRTLSGKAGNLAGSNKLAAASRQGVFVFVTVGDNMINAIQKSAQSKLLQLGLKTIVLDVNESAGLVTASARAEMQSADALAKARSILDGVRAMASLSDDPQAKTLLNLVNVTTNGLTLEVNASLPATELARLIKSNK